MLAAYAAGRATTTKEIVIQFSRLTIDSFGYTLCSETICA